MNVTKRNKIAVAQRVGMSPTAKERLEAVNNAALWWGRCPKCKIEVRGTLEQVRAHVCENG